MLETSPGLQTPIAPTMPTANFLPLSASDATLAAQHPHLLPRPHAGRMSEHALVAKNVRSVLKKAFPGVKFAVKAEANTMSASVRVTWDAWPDTPDQKLVQDLIQPFKAGEFNGMTDGFDYTNDPERRAFHKLFGSVEYVRANAHKVTQEMIVAREAEVLRKEMARQEKASTVPVSTDRARSRL